MIEFLKRRTEKQWIAALAWLAVVITACWLDRNPVLLLVYTILFVGAAYIGHVTTQRDQVP